MKYGFARAAAVTPIVRPGKPNINAETIATEIKSGAEKGYEIMIFPELCVTGCTVMDLLFTRELSDGAINAVQSIARETPIGVVAFIGAPIPVGGRLYNCAVAVSGGRVLGVVPKTEVGSGARYFAPKFDGVTVCESLSAPMGNILFKSGELVIGCEIGDDLWSDVPPSADMCRAGANVIVNLSACAEEVGKSEFRKLHVSSAASRMRCAYVYAEAGDGESTAGAVFSGNNIIAELNDILAEREPFADGVAVVDIDVERINVERRKSAMRECSRTYKTVEFELKDGLHMPLVRDISKHPFVPSGAVAAARCELILNMQARSLKKRMESCRAEKAVIGVSGGLDSTLALFVCVRAVGSDRVTALTLPAFGTTKKTRGNAEKLCAALGTELKTIDIKNTVTEHLKDIDHDKTDVVYENAQARYRTMVLLDYANKCNGLDVGTGDLSELALGWATFGGDHLSAYGVNGGVPKTLVKALVEYEGNRLGGNVKKAVDGVLSTEISPELLPPDGNEIVQKTEDILGKYDLLDFIIYYYLRYGFSREKISFLLNRAYSDVPAEQKIKALDTFYKRFLVSQFKRSCLSDGIKILSVSLSPHDDFKLPSDLG